MWLKCRNHSNLELLLTWLIFMGPAATESLPVLVETTATQVSSCITTHEFLNSPIQDASTEVNVTFSSSHYLSCNVALAVWNTEPLNTTYCIGSSDTKVKLFINEYSWTPRITCKSNHLIRITFEYLNRLGPTVRADSLAYSQWHKSDGGGGEGEGQNESTHVLIVNSEQGDSTRYTFVGVTKDHDNDDEYVQWVQDPIIVLVLYSPSDAEVGPEDTLIYSSEPAQADEDSIMISCLTAVAQTVQAPLVYQAVKQGDSCSFSPVDVDYDPMRGIRINLTHVSNYADHPFLCCSTEPAVPAQTENMAWDAACNPPRCVEFEILDPSDLHVSPKMFLPGSSMKRYFFASHEDEPMQLSLECGSWDDPVELEGLMNSAPINMTNNSNYSVLQTRSSPRVRYKATLKLGLEVLDWVQVKCLRVENLRNSHTDLASLYEWDIKAQGESKTTQQQRFNHSGDVTLLNVNIFVVADVDVDLQHSKDIDTHPAYMKFVQKHIYYTGYSHFLNRLNFQCYSEIYRDAFISVINCLNAVQCRLLEWCFESDQCQRVVNRSGSACVKPPNGSTSCQDVLVESAGALFQCSAGGQTYTQLRWQGLSRNMTYVYKEGDRGPWDQNMLEEMIRLEPEPNQGLEYYTQITYNFTCVMHPFWSTGKARIFFGFSDGRLEETGRLVSEDFSEGEKFCYERVMLLIPSIDVGRIICQTPLLDRDNAWINASLQLPRVTQSMKPEILNDVTEFQFDDDGKERRIPCNVTGLPKPDVLWSKRNKDGGEVIIQPVPDTSGVSVVNESVLHFERFEQGLEGVFTCSATNGVGSSSMEFRLLPVPENKLKPSSAWGVAGAAVGSIVVIVGLGLLLQRKFMFGHNRILDGEVMDRFRKGVNAREPKKHAVSIRRRRQEPRIHKLTEADLSPPTPGGDTGYNSTSWRFPTTEDEEELPYDTRFEISRWRIRIDRKRLLGRGQYGKVYAGTVRLGGLCRRGTMVKVAAKEPIATPEEIRRALAELKIMTKLQHQNLVRLVGASTAHAEFGRLHILMEFCEEGSLKEYFKRMKCTLVQLGATTHYSAAWTPDPRTLHRWCAEVATGMEFLASRGIVHRDLAARNVLLTASTELTAKVADFGLSRQLKCSSLYYKVTSLDLMLPCRWMALECFGGSFYTQSDVWSFGILAWEIFSIGVEPYNEVNFMTENMFVELGELLGTGFRITERHHATREVFAKMQECWRADRTQRPTFSELREFFSRVGCLQRHATSLEMTTSLEFDSIESPASSSAFNSQIREIQAELSH